MKNKVLIIGTSRSTRGGITSVIKTHESSSLWVKYRCKWLELQVNSTSLFGKLKFLLSGYIRALYLVPSYKVIHFHAVPGNCNKVQLPIVLWANLLRKRIITHVHVGNQLAKYKDNKLFRYVLSQSDLIITLADRWKKLIEDEYDIPVPVKVVYNPAPPLCPINEARSNYILYAAFLDKNKGYDIVLKAFEKIAKQYPDWKLVMAGSGPGEEEIKQYVEKHNLQHQVEMPGWITGEKKNILFKEASAFCLASYEEGFPMSVLDAWAMGTPVIATPVGGLPDVVTDGKNALLFEAGNVDMLSKQMSRLMSDKVLRNNLSEQSLILAGGIFEKEHIALELGSIYDILMNNNHKESGS